MSRSVGIASELLFRYECIKRDIIPSIPDLDDGAGFDCVTSYENKLYKIQVKSTTTKKGYGYKVSCAKGSKNKQRYTKDHCDFIAVYIVTRDLWYLIPIDKVNSITITLFPDKLNHKYSKYNSAWWLLAR